MSSGFEVVFDAAAERDIQEAELHHRAFGRGDAFLEDIDVIVMHLAERPAMYPVVYGDVHRALLARFPYSLYFVVEGTYVSVLAVQHQRRDPKSRPQR